MSHRPGTGLVGEKLAAGRTAEIYAWGEGQILKLFHPWVGSGDAEVEQRKTAAARALGLPVPAVGEVVQLGDRSGLVQERVEGQSMMGQLEREPGCSEEEARRLAQLHLTLHERTAEGLPAQREVLAGRLAQAPSSPPPNARPRSAPWTACLPATASAMGTSTPAISCSPPPVR
ncbi:MAG: hypothetical protein FJY95_06885 [Candidatus Handelsmanbacteria bacterium]|nr:hypothetical protein [Candidatus Handelsmanbacteria bacterium]